MLTDSFTPDAVAEAAAEEERARNTEAREVIAAANRKAAAGGGGALTLPTKVKKPAARAFTKKEAEDATARFHETKHAFRVQLLELWERKAHKVLGFTDDWSGFNAYAHEKLDINTGVRALQLQIESAKVSRNVGGEIPIAIGRQLARLTDEKQAEVWNEFNAMPDIEKQSATRMEPQIKRLVNKAIEAGGAAPTQGAVQGRGRPRKMQEEAASSLQEGRTAPEEEDEGNSPQNAFASVSAPPRTEWTLEEWQVEVGARPEFVASSPGLACDRLKQEASYLAEVFYDASEDVIAESVAQVFLALVVFANAQGLLLEATVKGLFTVATGHEPAIEDGEALAEAGYAETEEGYERAPYPMEEEEGREARASEFSEAGV